MTKRNLPAIIIVASTLFWLALIFWRFATWTANNQQFNH